MVNIYYETLSLKLYSNNICLDDRDVPARPVFDEKPNLKVDSMASRLRRISRSNNTSRTESLSLFKKIKNGK